MPEQSGDDKLISSMAQMLLGGAKLLSTPCPKCGGLLYEVDGESVCPSCASKTTKPQKTVKEEKVGVVEHDLLGKGFEELVEVRGNIVRCMLGLSRGLEGEQLYRIREVAKTLVALGSALNRVDKSLGLEPKKVGGQTGEDSETA